MKKFTVVDWQSFSLKKDIEKITKKLTDSNIIQSALLGELAIAVLAVGLNNIGVEKKCLFWVIVVVSILPLVLIFVRWCCEKHRERRPGSDRMDPRDFIDSFDNQIEYYTFMSESYYTMLLESLSGADSGVNDLSVCYPKM